jgi:hypothetical protein
MLGLEGPSFIIMRIGAKALNCNWAEPVAIPSAYDGSKTPTRVGKEHRHRQTRTYPVHLLFRRRRHPPSKQANNLPPKARWRDAA